MEKQHKTEAAIADLRMAVSKGGLEYIPMEVELLVKDGQVEAAAEALSTGITVTKFERETFTFQIAHGKVISAIPSFH